MSENERTAENDAVTLTDDERMAISAVVHQNYYMPDVFAAVERIVEGRLSGPGLAVQYLSPNGTSLTRCCCDRTTARLVACPVHPEARVIPPAMGDDERGPA